MVSLRDWYAEGRRDGWLGAEPLPILELPIETKDAAVYAAGYQDGVAAAREPLYCEFCGNAPCGVCGRGLTVSPR